MQDVEITLWLNVVLNIVTLLYEDDSFDSTSALRLECPNLVALLLDLVLEMVSKLWVSLTFAISDKNRYDGIASLTISATRESCTTTATPPESTLSRGRLRVDSMQRCA